MRSFTLTSEANIVGLLSLETILESHSGQEVSPPPGLKKVFLHLGHIILNGGITERPVNLAVSLAITQSPHPV